MAEIAKAYVQVIPSAKGIKNNLESEFDGSGQASGKAFASSFKKVLGGAAVLGAVAAVAKGMVEVIKSAVSSYADYEQLVGGTELMLGTAGQSLSEYAQSMGQSCSEAAGAYREMEATQNKVFDRANEAYKTAGISANDYLTQVNGLAVGLKTALGGDASAAADLADKVVTAESDVVAAMGVSTEAVQNAFNGLMKNNYTMLDNLALGITPTKEGFQEMIAKVNEYNAAQGNATNYTIDNLADCQSALVDYIAMQGISGYAAAEASTTIQGSLNSVKAAWENVLTALGGGMELDAAISNLIGSVATFAQNVTPIISSVVSGLVAAIPQLAAGVATLIPEIGTTLISNAPVLVTAGLSLMTSLLGAFTQMIPSIAAMIPEVVSAIVAAAPQLLTAGYALVTALLEALPSIITGLVQMIPQIVETLVAQAPALLTAGIQLFGALLEALVQVVPMLIMAIPQLFISLYESITAHGPEILEAAKSAFNGLVEGVKTAASDVWLQVTTMAAPWIETIRGWVGNFTTAAKEAFDGIVTGLGQAIAPVVGKIRTTISSGVAAVRSFVGRMKNAGRDLIQGLINGITAKLKEALDSIRSLGKQIVTTAETALKIGSPSKVFYEIGGYVSEGMANGIASGAGLVSDAADKMVSGTMAGLGAISSLDGAMASGVRGLSQINIYAQQLSQADIDYIVSTANRRLGAALA